MEKVPQYWKNLGLENIKYIDADGVEREEEWRPIKDYEDLYLVSNLGRIKALCRVVWNGFGFHPKPKHIMIQSVSDKRGYLRVALSRDSITKSQYVHIFVATAFIDNPLKKRTVNHKKGNKSDNRAWMLEWHTYGENHKHSYDELGRKHAMKGVVGYANKKSKELLCVTTGVKYGSLSEAGRILKIPFQNISKVCKGKRPNAHGLVFKYVNE